MAAPCSRIKFPRWFARSEFDHAPRGEKKRQAIANFDDRDAN